MTKRYITEALKTNAQKYMKLLDGGMDDNSAATFSGLRGEMRKTWPELSMMSAEFERLERVIISRASA